MLDPPGLIKTRSRPAAVLRLTVPRAEIQAVMGPGMDEVLAVVAAQGITPSGPLYTHHLRADPEVFDFEIGVPVPRAVEAAGRVQPGELPAARVARTIYRGPYEGLAQAWGELDAWVATEGHTPRPDLWECYVAGPESDPDPSTWRTELNRPLSDRGA